MAIEDVTGVVINNRRYPTTAGSLPIVPWSGSGITGAPDAELYPVCYGGVDLDGVAGALTYWVQGAVGSKAWVPTGGTVTNLWGAP